MRSGRRPAAEPDPCGTASTRQHAGRRCRSLRHGFGAPTQGTSVPSSFTRPFAPRAIAPTRPRDFVPSRRQGPARRPESSRFSGQRHAGAASIVPPKPEKVCRSELRVCIYLPTSPFGTVPTSCTPVTLATHALPLPTPADRGAARRASVAGARPTIRQARPSVADRRP